ncbi:MAG TPA: hypothetical protein VK923_16435 [Euzebyales bacterium]|nr:hypothetical protein [Euzebyales bacterium]
MLPGSLEAAIGVPGRHAVERWKTHDGQSGCSLSVREATLLVGGGIVIAAALLIVVLTSARLAYRPDVDTTA